MSEGRSSTESATMPDGAQTASMGGAAAADPLHGGPGTGESAACMCQLHRCQCCLMPACNNSIASQQSLR